MGGIPNHQYVNSESEHDGEDISGLKDIAEDSQGASSYLFDRVSQSQSHTVPGGGGGGGGERRWREKGMGEKRQSMRERESEKKKGTENVIKEAESRCFPKLLLPTHIPKNQQTPPRQHSRCVYTEEPSILHTYIVTHRVWVHKTLVKLQDETRSLRNT